MELDNLQTFFGLFSQWRFHIPDYQRGYAWGKDQWEDLLEDLSTLTEDNEHFTGLLVLHENRDPNLSVKTRGIPETGIRHCGWSATAYNNRHSSQ